MNEKFLAQLFLELQHAQTEAFALLTQALCRQLNAAQLRADLDAITKTYLQMPQHNDLSVKLLQGALAAAHAEQMLQARPPSEGPHPTREG